jgi:hypothetical protein
VSPQPPERRLYVVEIVIDEGTPDELFYVCFDKPEWVDPMWAGVELPEWVTLETVGGALVAIRSSSFNTVTQYRRVVADLDSVALERTDRSESTR